MARTAPKEMSVPLITGLITVLSCLVALSSAIAAFFWYQASTGRAWAHENGRMNQIAALWSAWAALFTFLSYLLGLLKHA